MTEAAEQNRAWHDPIVTAVRRVREELYAAAGYDIREFCRRLREKQPRSGHPIVTRAPREPRRPGEAA
jgi:hypothetical protein